MRVKRLEIQGFKSFKDKTIIHFDHSITGIVGPNGCGKSNIVDAFFWVMGEQSYKHIRGSGSDDLIFNGSSKYAPLGYAEATLVMETDAPDTANAPSGATIQDVPIHLRAKEVSVTRRVYRSGEGEYFINGIQSRLKDIHELFMDTGVGAKGYSIIEQGQIGKIVNSKPDERRLLIEEAAGIAKYKARKKESLRKVEAATGNLSRLNDLIQEIERNLSSLERQAHKAQQFKKIKEELLDKEMTWGRRKHQVLNQKIASLQKNRELLEQDLITFRAELSIVETTIEVDRSQHLIGTKNAEDLQFEVQTLSKALNEKQSALELSRQRQSDLIEKLDSLNNEKSDLEVQIDHEAIKLKEKKHWITHSESEFEKLSVVTQGFDEKSQQASKLYYATKQTFEQNQKHLILSVQEASLLSNKRAGLIAQKDSYKSQILKTGLQKIQSIEKLGQAEIKKAEITLHLQNHQSERDSLISHKTQKDQFHQILRASIKDLDTTVQAQKTKTLQFKSKLQSLQELDESFEGYGDGPKTALEWAKSKSLPLTALMSHIQVLPGYESAFESYFEDKIQTLITEDVELAVSTLKHIQNEKKGRAQIAILQSGLPKTDDSTLKLKTLVSQTGAKVLGVLADFVTNDFLDRKSFLEHLSKIVVVETLTPELFNISFQSGAIVSKDGFCLSPDMILRGGSIDSNQTSSVLGRKSAIKSLSLQLQTEELQLQEFVNKLDALNLELIQLESEIELLKSSIQRFHLDVLGLEKDNQTLLKNIVELLSQIELFEYELSDLTLDQTQVLSELDSTETQLSSMTQSRVILESQISTNESDLNTLGSLLKEAEEELNQARIAEAQARERFLGLGREIAAVESLISDRQNRIQEIQRIVQSSIRERDQFSAGDSDLTEAIAKLIFDLGSKQDSLGESKNLIEILSSRINNGIDRIKELHQTGDSKVSEANQTVIEVEKLGSDLVHLVQNLEEKYGFGCLELPVTSPIQEEMSEPIITAEMTAEDERTLGEEVDRLREKIRRLGEVNVMAIQEYEEVKVRYDYLVGERLDLEKSIQNLQDAIEHINKTSEERFKKAFDAISDRFERLFPIIFGGGSAKLTLVYPEDSQELLDAGVDIIAQPPGKKVSNITLLSGGEKALTAVAMIFAIFMVKPSPFCLLDEVDAPLDDANIGKFNALLREMAVKSQFIIITHNKKTMELNDTLYGVTMEEPGVSKMVSIEIK